MRGNIVVVDASPSQMLRESMSPRSQAGGYCARHVRKIVTRRDEPRCCVDQREDTWRAGLPCVPQQRLVRESAALFSCCSCRHAGPARVQSWGERQSTSAHDLSGVCPRGSLQCDPYGTGIGFPAGHRQRRNFKCPLTRAHKDQCNPSPPERFESFPRSES